MMRKPIRLATELAPEERFVGVFSAFELDSDTVRAAVQLSDNAFETVQTVVLRFSMTDEALAEIEFKVDELCASFASSRGGHSVLLESGNVVHHDLGSGWSTEFLEADFLRYSHVPSNSEAYIFGGSGEVFAYRSKVWTPLFAPTQGAILAMAGSIHKQLFAAGSDGQAFRLEDDVWEVIDTSVGVDFRGVAFDTDRLFLAGEGGVAMITDGSEAVELETDVSSDFLSVVSHGGSIYFSDSKFGLFKVVGTKLQPVANIGFVNKQSSGPNWLTASAGAKVIQFDGTEFRGVEIVFDEGYRIRPLSDADLLEG